MRMPAHHTIVVVDVEGSSQLTNAEKPVVREELYRLLAASVRAVEVDWPDLVEDRGDGAYLLFPAHVQKHTLLRAFAGELHRRLAQRSVADLPIRLRIAIHSGEVTPDRSGSSGLDVDAAFAMADSRLARDGLSVSRRAQLVIIVADSFYESVVLGQALIDPGKFRAYGIETKKGLRRVWLHLPGVSQQPALQDAVESSTAAQQDTARAQTNMFPVQVAGNWNGSQVNGSTISTLKMDHHGRG